MTKEAIKKDLERYLHSLLILGEDCFSVSGIKSLEVKDNIILDCAFDFNSFDELKATIERKLEHVNFILYTDIGILPEECSKKYGINMKFVIECCGGCL